MGVVAQFLNDAEVGGGWRISLDGLEKGGAGIVCSVLFWPACEFDFARLYNEPPLDNYFEYVQRQLQYVEETLPSKTKKGTPVVIVRNSNDLARDGIRFVHCLEGGFHLGEDVGQLDERVAWLAQRGVLYITVAHLFYREVATNAPAIWVFQSDDEYRKVFPEPNKGLTDRGVKLVEAMYKHKVLVDITHMTDRAVRETFALVERLDEENPDRDPKQYPIIATHVGMREIGPKQQEYNLTPDTVQKIERRQGLVGLIASQHQLGEAANPDQSAAVVKQHLDAIGKAVGDASAVAAVGTDMDGFIKPTLGGLQKAEDLTRLEEWVRDAAEANPAVTDTEAILHGNAERVIRAAFSSTLTGAAPAKG